MASVADWVGAIGTAGALFAAVYTLWRQVQADVRSHAQKVNITFHQNNGQGCWSIVNSGELAVKLQEVRAIFHHAEGMIGEVVRTSGNDGWRFMRNGGWSTTLTRAWALVKAQPLPPVHYPDQRTRGRLTTLKRDGQLLKPKEEAVCPLPLSGPDVGVVLRAGFTDSTGRNWWRVWPSGELKSAWDPDFWSVRRRIYICRAIEVMPLILAVVTVTLGLVSAPVWSIVVVSIVFVAALYVAQRVFRFYRNFPARFLGLSAIDNPATGQGQHDHNF